MGRRCTVFCSAGHCGPRPSQPRSADGGSINNLDGHGEAWVDAARSTRVGDAGAGGRVGDPRGDRRPRRKALLPSGNVRKGEHGDSRFQQSSAAGGGARCRIPAQRRRGVVRTDEGAASESADGQAHAGGQYFFSIPYRGDAEGSLRTSRRTWTEIEPRRENGRSAGGGVGKAERSRSARSRNFCKFDHRATCGTASDDRSKTRAL